ncbi:hypothetical protein DY000_02000458 [Brassica cretica]|uniref:Uncharacterized protein n=1 Tax=Brassica cretica TaxID=69181 RepID=A0ABQ7CKK6_BRACR|nr:hypothetical protein DY000_02000458 [Brassica cretica]
MQTRWALSGRASAVQPASSTSGEALLPPPFPPDPPDPLSPLSPHLFPPLDSTPPLTRSQTRRSHLTATHVDTVMTQAQHPTTASAISQATTQRLQISCGLVECPTDSTIVAMLEVLKMASSFMALFSIRKLKRITTQRNAFAVGFQGALEDIVLYRWNGQDRPVLTSLGGSYGHGRQVRKRANVTIDH